MTFNPGFYFDIQIITHFKTQMQNFRPVSFSQCSIPSSPSLSPSSSLRPYFSLSAPPSDPLLSFFPINAFSLIPFFFLFYPPPLFVGKTRYPSFFFFFPTFRHLSYLKFQHHSPVSFLNLQTQLSKERASLSTLLEYRFFFTVLTYISVKVGKKNTRRDNLGWVHAGWI